MALQIVDGGLHVGGEDGRRVRSMRVGRRDRADMGTERHAAPQ